MGRFVMTKLRSTKMIFVVKPATSNQQPGSRPKLVWGEYTSKFWSASKRRSPHTRLLHSLAKRCWTKNDAGVEVGNQARKNYQEAAECPLYLSNRTGLAIAFELIRISRHTKYNKVGINVSNGYESIKKEKNRRSPTLMQALVATKDIDVGWQSVLSRSRGLLFTGSVKSRENVPYPGTKSSTWKWFPRHLLILLILRVYALQQHPILMFEDNRKLLATRRVMHRESDRCTWTRGRSPTAEIILPYGIASKGQPADLPTTWRTET